MTTAMSAPERVSSEEFRDIAQAHRDVCHAHRDYLRLARLREQRAKQRENTASASSVDAPDSGSTKDDPGGITEATSSSQMIDSGQPQGGVTLAEMMGDKTRALEEYERLILIGPQRLVRGENDTDVPQGYYELGEGAPFPFEGAKDQDRVAVNVVELYDFDKMSLVREDEEPAYVDWPEAVQMGLQVLWPAPLLLPPLRQTVTQQPRQVDHQREAERFKKPPR